MANTKIYGPPIISAPITDDAWRRWFTDVVWPIIGAGVGNSGPQGTFPQLQVGKASFTNENAFQELLNVDQGIYVTYSSTVQNIVYGFACNVHRAAGDQFTVGAQINAWGEVGSTGDVFGIACTALCQPASGNRALIGIEPDIASLANANTGAKWGMNPVFKDRGDGATTAPDGLGSNQYNYFSEAIVLTSQVRSATGENCGWNCGIDFLDAALDQSVVLAWSATVTYSSGMIVSSGGVLWKAIQTSINQAPIAGSAYWVQHTYAGTTNLAVGIDFSSMSTTSMTRMASAIRLRSSMYMHWDESGAVGTLFNATTSIHHVCDNQGNLRLGVDVGTGLIYTAIGTIAPGGGAGATLGTIGGTGPATAAQNSWGRMNFNGTTYFIPLWT